MKSFVVYLAILFVTQAQEIAYYEDIKNLPNTPEILLIDVREPYEVEGTGLMPTAVNIPCKFEIVRKLRRVLKLIQKINFKPLKSNGHLA